MVLKYESNLFTSVYSATAKGETKLQTPLHLGHIYFPAFPVVNVFYCYYCSLPHYQLMADILIGKWLIFL